MSELIKVALVGVGGYGNLYLETLLKPDQCPGVELVGCVDTDPNRCQRLAELASRQIPIHEDLETLFQHASVDLTMIATPIHLHADHTCTALGARAHVLCEKPLAADLQGAKRMAAAERASGKFVAIGYQWAFSAVVQSLKQEILKGTFGAPKRMKTLVFFPRPASYFKRNDWAGRICTSADQPVLDSPVNNATAHYLHLMLYLLGSTRENSAQPKLVRTERYRVNAIENFDTAAMRVITEDDVEVLFYTTHAVPQRLGPLCKMEFEDADVIFDGGRGGNVLAHFRSGEVRNMGRCDIDHAEKIYQCIDSVRTGNPVACGIAAAVPHTLCVHAAHHSKTPIHSIPKQWHRPLPTGNDVLHMVQGLSDVLRQCFFRNLLPAELDDVPWAQASDPVDVRTLHEAPAIPSPARKVAVTLSDVRGAVSSR